MSKERNYNLEFDNQENKYAYNFDYNVMHHYFIEAMKPFFKGNQVLELGCFKGFFTKRLEEIFTDVTCIEASDKAILEAKKILKETTKIINSTFEKVVLNKKYKNIVMTHVLEHIEDPIFVLSKIRNEWLDDDGKFLVICPNANAASRQIAVKMGLISHNSAVTESESKHGHNITYSLDTLESTVRKAGFKVIHRSGIFFKALANFQWDKLLQTDIVSKDYLEGCYQLGQIYPDLCASIFLVCEK